MKLLDTNVRRIVFPGAIHTNIAANSGLGNRTQAQTESCSGKITSPAKAAQLIIEGIERNRYHILVGQDAKIMDLIYRLNPRYAAKLIYTKMKAKFPS